MSIAFVFWLLMLLWIFFWGLRRYSPNTVAGFPWGGDLLIFILFFLLGWHDFGWPIHG